MFWSGEMIARYITNAIDKEKQTQPNGFDLTVKGINHLNKPWGYLGFENRTRVFPSSDSHPMTFNSYWDLHRGAYLVRYNERIEIPPDTLGFVQPRSSLMRMGATISSAFWDSGYKGQGVGLLQVFYPLMIERNARIAQIAFVETSPLTKSYEGVFQNE